MFDGRRRPSKENSSASKRGSPQPSAGMVGDGPPFGQGGGASLPVDFTAGEVALLAELFVEMGVDRAECPQGLYRSGPATACARSTPWATEPQRRTPSSPRWRHRAMGAHSISVKKRGLAHPKPGGGSGRSLALKRYRPSGTGQRRALHEPDLIPDSARSIDTGIKHRQRGAWISRHIERLGRGVDPVVVPGPGSGLHLASGRDRGGHDHDQQNLQSAGGHPLTAGDLQAMPPVASPMAWIAPRRGSKPKFKVSQRLL